MKRKILTLVMTLALLCTMLPLSVSAEGETTNLVIHKVLMSETDLASHDSSKTYDPATGIGSADFKTFFSADATEIDGVYFVAIPKTETTNIALADKGDFSFLDTPAGAAYKAGLTAPGGLKLTGLADGTYRIYEVKSKTNYKGPKGELLAKNKAVPIEITLPLENEDGRIPEVHLYPKNTQDGPTVDKTVTDLTEKEGIFDFNEVHTWFIQGMIPDKIEDYQIYNFTDVLAKELNYKSNVKVYVVEKDAQNLDTPVAVLQKGIDYKVAEPTVTAPTATTPGTDKERTLMLDFKVNDNKPFNNLAAYAGKKLVITFDTTINELAVMGSDIPNEVTLKYGHNPNSVLDKKPDTPPKVVTGGKRFIKQDGTSHIGLGGAEFKIKNEAGQYLQKDYTWGPSSANDVVLTSEEGEDTGHFEIKGLKYGTYHLVETKAPKDYIKLQEDIPFVVDKTSYYTAPVTVIDPDMPGDAQQQVIDNSKVKIPLTGGIGTIVFTVGGLFLMAGAIFAIKRRRSMED